MKAILGLLFIICLCACSAQQKRQEEFDNVKIGMLKSEVLDITGHPHWSDRYDGMDAWYYYMKPGDRQTEKVLYFKDGKVSLKGLRKQPLLTADEAEQLKKPKSKEQEPFKPKYPEDELRKVLKKEVQKANDKKSKSKMEVIE